MKLNLRFTATAGSLGLSVAFAHAVSLAPIADTRVLSVFPNSVDGGNNFFSVWNSGPSNEQHSLLLFDYSSLAGQTVVSATLRLHGSSFAGSSATTTTSVYRPTMSWSESQATWINASTGNPWTNPGGDLVGTTGALLTNPFFSLTGPMTVSNSIYELDVTTLVAGQVDGTWANFGIALTGDLNNQLIFNSREEADSALRPELIVQTQAVPEPSTIVAIIGLSGCLLNRRRRK